MRSGQYKISSSKVSVGGGTFRSSCTDLPLLVESSICEQKVTKQPHHKSCESIGLKLATSSVISSKSFSNLLNVDNSIPVPFTSTPISFSNSQSSFSSPLSSLASPTDSLSPLNSLSPQPVQSPSNNEWEFGQIVTVRKRPRTKGAIFNSDTSSYGSVSSGYSSSSSSYGSFKSCCSSGTSTLTRISAETFKSPWQNEYREMCFSNPIYDLIPSTAPKSLDSTSSEEIEDDPIAKQCKDYFEKRLIRSRSFVKKWISKSDSGLNSEQDSGVDEGNNSGLDSMEQAASEEKPVEEKDEKKFEKTKLDTKLDYLRKEMVCLMDRDNALFKQLLALHSTISTLKSRHALRPHSPSSNDSDEEIDETKERIKKIRSKKHSFRGVFDFGVISHSMGDVRKVDGDDEEDEGHFTDLSLSQSPSHSPSPPSTISSHSSKDSAKRSSLGSNTFDSNMSFTRARKSYAPTARNRRRSSSVHQPKPSSHNMTYGATTALVLVHKDDEEVLFKGSHPPRIPKLERTKSESTTFFNLDSISLKNLANSIPGTNLSEIRPVAHPGVLSNAVQPLASRSFSSPLNGSNLGTGLSNFSKSSGNLVNTGTCSSYSSQTSPSNKNVHPAYREALIL